MGAQCCTAEADTVGAATQKYPTVSASHVNHLWARERKDNDNPKNKMGEDKTEEIKAFLQREDANKDGLLDRNEAEKICKKFFFRATGQDTKLGKYDEAALDAVFKMFDADSDGQLNMGEFGLMMKTYWLMKVPGLKIQEFLLGPERGKWENLCKEFNERQR